MTHSKWQFEQNQNDVSEGPNNAGIASFTGDRAGSLVREMLQNSIDARDSHSDPVEVKFDFIDLPTDAFDIDKLYDALGASIKSEDNDDRHRKQFKRGLRLLQKAKKDKSLPTLIISDSNTVGATDIDGKRDKWHSLTKSEGKSQKDARDAGGSFGIGKHAAFAATDIRTVLYSTAFKNNGRLERRFRGRSILVSHERNGRAFKSRGYLESKSSIVPDALRLDAPGTTVAVLGFNVNKRTKESWLREAREAVEAHFFHAIIHGNLIIRLEDEIIDCANFEKSMSKRDDGDKLRRLASVSAGKIQSETSIEGIGSVRLRIEVEPEGSGRGKILALVRDSGMMITDTLAQMKVSPSQQMVRFPASWKGFTAIVECLSMGERSLLREAEGPRHDQISPDNADESERLEIRNALRELGRWIRQEIESVAKPPEPASEANATEMAMYLSLPGDDTRSTNEGNGKGFEATEPVQTPKPPAGLGIPGGGRRSGSGSKPGPGVEQGRGRGKKKGKGSAKPRRYQELSTVFSNMRRLPSALNQWPTHSAAFTFDKPDTTPKRIELFGVGEDGRADRMPIERAYYPDGRRMKVDKGAIVDINEKLMGGSRARIDIKSLRPVADRRIELRSVV